jgi:hypothetical protein
MRSLVLCLAIVWGLTLAGASAVFADVIPPRPPIPPPPPPPPTSLTLQTIVAGTAVSLAGVAAGLWIVRRYRGHSQPALEAR